MRKVIGILGGMGPAATVELFSRIVNNTNATKDEDHVKLVIINDPSIPDRTEYILGNGQNPVPKLKENLNLLINSKVDAVIIPCMTAHAFITELQEESSIPIINGIKLVEEYLNSLDIAINRVGLLATTGSVKSKAYNNYLSREIITPSDENQNKLMDIIYGEKGIKAGFINTQILNELLEIIYSLKEKGAQAFIAGCTELGLVLNNENTDELIIDPVDLLALKAIELGTKRKSNENVKWVRTLLWNHFIEDNVIRNWQLFIGCKICQGEI